MDLTRTQHTHLLTLGEDDAVLNNKTLDRWFAVLETVETLVGDEPTPSAENAALVLTGTGKSFHQGLDLTVVPSLSPSEREAYLGRVHHLFVKLLSLPMPTVAAVNGHAQGAGAMIALCTDVRIMRADRGWFRLPEVVLGLPFTPLMDALVSARIPQPAAHRLMVLSQQVGGREAASVGVVDVAIEGAGGALQAALETAAELAPLAGTTIAEVRRTRYAEVLALLETNSSATP